MDDFYIADISDELFAKMKGKSYKDDWEGRKDYQHFEMNTKTNEETTNE